jgi:hypothetical protein
MTFALGGSGACDRTLAVDVGERSLGLLAGRDPGAELARLRPASES